MVQDFQLILKQNIMANIAWTHILTSSRLGSGDVMFGSGLATWKGQRVREWVVEICHTYIHFDNFTLLIELTSVQFIAHNVKVSKVMLIWIVVVANMKYVTYKSIDLSILFDIGKIRDTTYLGIGNMLSSRTIHSTLASKMA